MSKLLGALEELTFLSHLMTIFLCTALVAHSSSYSSHVTSANPLPTGQPSPSSLLLYTPRRFLTKVIP